MAAMTYLSVQDMIWINLQVANKVNEFRFDRLEEGTFCQYAYGKSTDIRGQAARFLAGFVKNAPFESGNEGTALIAVLGFLKLNGLEVSLDPSAAAGWLRKGASTSEAAVAAINEVARDGSHGEHAEEPSDVLENLLTRYAKSLAELSNAPARAS